MTLSATNKWRWIERSFTEDLDAAWRQRGLAWTLYLSQVAEHRRNSGLGLAAPFISVFLHVSLLGAVMALVFHEPLTTFIPFFAISIALWQGISISVSEASHANERAFRLTSFPTISGYVVHLVEAYNLIVSLALKSVAAILVIAAVNWPILQHANYPAFLVGIVTIVMVMTCWSLPMAYAFDRLRLLRGFLPQMLFAVYLITPILWSPSRLDGHHLFVSLNPVFHLIQCARVPLLEGGLPLSSLAVSWLVGAVGVGASALVFRVNRNLIVYRWIS